MAAACGVGLAKVSQQRTAPAFGGFRVAHQRIKAGGASGALRSGAIVNEPADHHGVDTAVEKETVGSHAIPSGAPNLLIVALDVLGQVVMQDKADVRLVDTHAERDG